MGFCQQGKHIRLRILFICAPEKKKSWLQVLNTPVQGPVQLHIPFELRLRHSKAVGLRIPKEHPLPAMRNRREDAASHLASRQQDLIA